VEGVFHDDYESHRIVEGEDPNLARALADGIRATGERAIAGLNGTFAGCFIDLTAGSLMTFVDRLGTRDLYWRQAAGEVVVSSNLAAFRPLASMKLDLESAFQFLTIGFPIGERTLLEGISIHPPASVKVFTSTSHSGGRYWTVPERREDMPLSSAVARISES